MENLTKKFQVIKALLKTIKNNVINWIIIKYYTFKGYKMSKNFIEGETYYNTLKKTYGIYRGNNTFYETQQCCDNMYGVVFYDSRNIKYTNLQIGLFKLWVKTDGVKIETDCGPELLNNSYKT